MCCRCRITVDVPLLVKCCMYSSGGGNSRVVRRLKTAATKRLTRRPLVATVKITVEVSKKFHAEFAED